jgi:hypothetical protein
VTEAPVLVVRNIRINEQVHNPTILLAEPYGNVRNGIPTSKLLEYHQHQFLFIGTKVHDGLANIFLGGVTENVELGLISP